MTLPEYTPPYQNTPPFSTTKCDPPRIYPPPLPEYTPLFNNYIIMRHSQNRSLPEYTPSLSTTICDTLRNYPSLREYPPPPFVRQLYAPSVSEYISPHLSTIICDIPRIYPSVTEYAPFSRRFCYYERIYHLLPELKNILGGRGRFWEGRI